MFALSFWVPKTAPAAVSTVNTHAYRYYRINITASTGGPYIITLEIRATAGGADTAFGNVTATASDFVAGFDPIKAFDNDTSTFFASNLDPSVTPVWLQADYGATSGNWRAANEFKLIPQGTGQAPTTGTFDGSDDASSWTTLKSFSGLSWSAGECGSAGTGKIFTV